MAATTNEEGQHLKSVYVGQYDTGGQTQVVSSGAYQLVESGGRIDNRGEMLQPVVVHTSNSTMIANRGFAVLNSSMDIQMRLRPPVTGSLVKLVFASTNPVKDNAVYQIIVESTLPGSTNARLVSSTCRMITLSTMQETKPFKFIELVGTTQLYGKRLWLVSNMGPYSSDITNFAISSATD